MMILQIWCGDLFLNKHLKLAIDKMAKKVYTIVLSHEFLLLITPAKNETCSLVCVSHLGEIRCSYTLFFFFN